jgi:hypothetical protein
LEFSIPVEVAIEFDMPKERINIPIDLATEVIFASDRTCCVCEVRGKAIQIHHIDENPSNNTFDNLAVLCLECHNDTQLSGGFGRRLSEPLVIKYRNEWLIRVTNRKISADIKISEGFLKFSEYKNQTNKEIPYKTLANLIKYLPKLKHEILKQAQDEWDSGETIRICQASYEYIDVLQGFLVMLAQYYSVAQFGNKSSQEFFSDLIASRFEWHSAHMEPNGFGTGGTIISVMRLGSVMGDVEKMVEDMVISLIGDSLDFDATEWLKQWNEANIELP